MRVELSRASYYYHAVIFSTRTELFAILADVTRSNLIISLLEFHSIYTMQVSSILANAQNSSVRYPRRELRRLRHVKSNFLACSFTCMLLDTTGDYGFPFLAARSKTRAAKPLDQRFWKSSPLPKHIAYRNVNIDKCARSHSSPLTPL